MEIPDVRYTRSGDVAIAYQTVGDGERDLVLLPFLANIWSFWRLYGFAEFGHKLASGRRLTVINPRGVGLSDRPRGFTIESRMDDIRAVMDALGMERATTGPGPRIAFATSARGGGIATTSRRWGRR